MTQIAIAFLGQCHTSGYPGVPRDATFPEIARRTLEARRPGLVIEVVLEPYEHPSELPRAVAKALRAGPRVVVIEVIDQSA